ncbi:MAG: glycosyltransferase family 2 protein [Bacteroidales bacterium]|nr:glycosyltransferase family 2 protein [Bacteroidales bacterium]MDD4362471.1 glycosyltransferase family 2 protein [Bacteroidales bacterium]MDD4430296.1 glycosyltransferase family 2 protein [Bacteroidales bacterium]
MDISIVIPLYNEAESLPELFKRIQTVMEQNRFSFEVIFVDDGSKDASWQVITELKEAHPDQIRALKFRRNYGKSPALFCGFKKAEGEVVFTMDADLQDRPEELPEMYRTLIEGNYDLVSGWKKKRYDSKVSKNLPSKIYNATARSITGIKLHDMNCGLKAYRKEVIKNIEVYGEMHRYIPYLAKNAGYNKIGEKVVQHQKRKFGQSKFGLNRFAHGYLDLMTLWFLSHFGKRPMHFFGLMGSLLFLLGFVAIVVLGVMKISMLNQGIPFRLITDISYFYLALTCILLGTQLFLAGFLAEMISRNASERNNYIVDQEL